MGGKALSIKIFTTGLSKSPQLHVQYSHFILQHMENTHEALQDVSDMFLPQALLEA